MPPTWNFLLFARCQLIKTTFMKTFFHLAVEAGKERRRWKEASTEINSLYFISPERCFMEQWQLLNVGVDECFVSDVNINQASAFRNLFNSSLLSPPSNFPSSIQILATTLKPKNSTRKWKAFRELAVDARGWHVVSTCSTQLDVYNRRSSPPSPTLRSFRLF